MTTVRQQIYDVAAAYAPFLALVYGGTAASLFGGDSTPDPPPNLKECPWFYLELLSDTESFDGNPNYLESGFRWWGYDLPHAGHVRTRKALGTLGKAPGYLESACEDSSPYADSDTGEVVFWQRPVGFGTETEDLQRGLTVLTHTWQTRKSFRGVWP